jgi:hypothetical protein
VDDTTGVVFAAEADPPRLVVTDTVGGRQYDLLSDGPVDPTPVDPDDPVPVPVERGVELETGRLRTTTAYGLHVRGCDGEHVGAIGFGGAETYEATGGTGCPLYLELDAPVKTYLRVPDRVVVDRREGGLRIAFDESTSVRVYARAWRRRPTHEVTIGEDPQDLMRALSLFGTALQTTSPERSYPTLRGHPPAVTVGADFDADGLSPPDTGITIETPPRLEAVIPVAPLAYYLGAEVAPGNTFAIKTDQGFTHESEASAPGGVATAARRTLERAFVLDCAVRTAGLYTYDFDPTRALGPSIRERVGADVETVYGYTPADRIEAAFALPYDRLAEEAPEWPRVGYVEPRWASVPSLPSLVDTLAPVEAIDPPRVRGPAARGRLFALTARTAMDDRTRSVSRVSVGDARYADLVDIDQPDGVETVARRRSWVGEDVPLGANYHLQVAARNRHEAELEPTEPPIRVAVVSNEAEMDGELAAVRETYGDLTDDSFDVTVERRLRPEQLRALLESDVDFLHYVGHATPDGLRCLGDRYVDVGEVAHTGVTAFCLNACESYTQGRRLIEAGALGGIVTHGEVNSDLAHRIGATLSRLLNNGFPLAAALDVAGTVHPVGTQYTVLGGAGVSVAQSGSAGPTVWIPESDGNGYDATIETYQAPSQRLGVGTVWQSVLESDDCTHLSPGTHGPFEASRGDFRGVLEPTPPPPFSIGGRIHWAGDAASALDEM